MTYELLDPSGEIDNSLDIQLTERISKLEGACIGFISNQANAELLLKEVEKILTSEYKVKNTISIKKTNQNKPADENIINELVNCDAVVNGVGD